MIASGSDQRTIEWSTLKLKWGPDPLISNDDSFTRQPRTVQQALQEQYEKLPDGLENQCIGKHQTGHTHLTEKSKHRLLSGEPS